MADYYETLGVARDAGSEEIKKAFRRLARETHPDANPGDASAEERFREIAEAYEVLSDPQRRAAYDRGDRIDLGDLFSSFAGVEDLLSRFFGGGSFGPFGGVATGPAPGRDVGVKVSITLAEAATGVEREVAYRAPVACTACRGTGSAPGSEPVVCERCHGQGSVRVTRQTMLGTAMTIAPCDRCGGRGRTVVDPCDTCRGGGAVVGDVTVTVAIPEGIEDGTRLRLSGRGAAGEPGARSGDLIVAIGVTPDPRFTRHGPDLVHRAQLGLAEVALGRDILVPTITGDDLEVTVPPGTQPGTVFKLSRQGMPRLHRRGRGDLLVEVVVTVPTELTAAQEEALRAYAAASGEEPSRSGRRRRR